MLKEGYLEENYHYFHLRDTAGDERDYHYHDFDKIVILLSGKVDYAVENEVFSLKPYDILTVKHHSIHKAMIDKSLPYERVIIYLREDRYASMMPEARLTKCFDKSIYTIGTDKVSYIIDAIESAENEIMKEIFIIQLLAILATSSETVQIAKTNDNKMEPVLSYINENLTSILSVDILAEILHMSRYHFMRQFKNSTGQTVHSYVRQHRLFYASRLIRQGIPVQEAASRSGFDDYSVFYKAFRDSFGFSPKELKN